MARAPVQTEIQITTPNAMIQTVSLFGVVV